MKNKLLHVVLIGVALATLANSALAAFDRPMEPVIVLGSECGKFLSKPIAGLRVYSYTASTNTWQPIPFQVDEFTTPSLPNEKKLIVWEGDGMLTAFDEIVFMGKDVGDKAADESWPAAAQVKGTSRYQIVVKDPATPDSAFVYIYHADGLPTNSTSYVSYKTDRVLGQSYGLGHDTSVAGGFPDSLAMPGNNIDFMDSWRLRVLIKKLVAKVDGIGNVENAEDIYFSEEKEGTVKLKSGIISITANVKVFHEKNRLKVKAGNIRVLRQHTLGVRFWFSFLSYSIDDTSHIPILIKYYGNSSEFQPSFSITLGNEITTLNIDYLEFSSGFVANSQLMKFYGNGFLQQGSTTQDSLIDKLPPNTAFKKNLLAADWPGKHWYGFSGTPTSTVKNASLFTIVDLDSTRLVNLRDPALLYYDYSAPNSNDPAGVYGIAGLRIYDWTQKTISIEAKMRSFYFAKNSSRSEFQTLFDKYKNLGTLQIAEQPLPDKVAPGKITDLRISARTDNSMTLTWTARGDDGDTGGRASRYVIRYSTVAPTLPDGQDWQWWEIAKDNSVPNPPTPAEPGMSQTLLVPDLAEATIYYFRINAVDFAGNTSGLSNTATTWTTPVELVSFAATVNRLNSVLLTWKTASETNNLGFAIERRFETEEPWQQVGFVNGAGTTVDEHNYAFTDTPGKPGDWFYRLKQLDADGASAYSEPVFVSLAKPEKFVLLQNYPNPFNPATTISFQVPETAHGQMTLVVYDMLGRQVRSLLSEPTETGFYDVTWDGYDDAGLPVSSGVYIYRLRAGDFTATKKMIKLQ